MGNCDILNPGTYVNSCETPTTVVCDNANHLVVDKFLSEYDTLEEKGLVRTNLEIYSKDEVYTKSESERLAKKLIYDSMTLHLREEDPHGTLVQVDKKLENVVLKDGTTPFEAPQKGVDPILDYHLATKGFVESLLRDHLRAEDPHNCAEKIKDALQNYVKKCQVYLKNETLSKSEIDCRLKNFVMRDGSTPITAPLLGVDPQMDSHLATKRYVDKVIWLHLTDVDPHGFMTVLNQRLSNYYNKNDVYTKAQTYSRAQIDAVIRSLIDESAREAIESYFLKHLTGELILEEIERKKFVKQDGSTPFKAPQEGVDGEEDNHLVTLKQLKELKELLLSKEPIWKTSGAVEAEVGLVERDTEFPEEVTMQEILDAIFYGKRINIKGPEYANIMSKPELEISIHGSLAEVNHVELYMNGELKESFLKEQFVPGNGTLKTLSPEPIKEDTTYKVILYYNNGSIHDNSTVVKVAMHIFVGIVPKMFQANTVTFDKLVTLSEEDTINNKFYTKPNTLTSLEHKFNFSDPELKELMLVIPKSYNKLYQLQTPSLQFIIDDFSVIDDIPLRITGMDKDTIYRIYTYKHPLVKMDLPVKYVFN